MFPLISSLPPNIQHRGFQEPGRGDWRGSSGRGGRVHDVVVRERPAVRVRGGELSRAAQDPRHLGGSVPRLHGRRPGGGEVRLDGKLAARAAARRRAPDA